MKVSKWLFCLCLIFMSGSIAEAQIVARVISGSSSYGPVFPGGSTPLSTYSYTIQVTSTQPMLLSSIVAGWDLTKYYKNMNGQTLTWTRTEAIPLTLRGPQWVTNFMYTISNGGYPPDQLVKLRFRAVVGSASNPPTQVEVRW